MEAREWMKRGGGGFNSLYCPKCHIQLLLTEYEKVNKLIDK